MRCSTCHEPIARTDATASGPDGESHSACAKRMTAQGQAIDLQEAFEEIGHLKRRVQELERVTDEQAETLLDHARDIPFRIGGGE